MLSKKSGITLIALVITIIVLLILAGISISMIVSKNGIVEKALSSSKKTNKSEAEEKVLMEVEGSYDGTGKVNLNFLNDNLRDNLGDVEFKYGDEDEYQELTEENKIEKLPVIVKYRGYDFDVDEEFSNVDDNGSSSDGEKTPKLEKPESDDKTLEIGEVVINDNPLDKGWKYFCQDDDNYYFIYEDYFDSDAIPNPGKSCGGNIEIREDYCLWSMNGEDQAKRDDLVNYLLGVENYAGIWDQITDAVKKALRKKELPEDEINKISTTGTPTKEQFADAYNERYSETGKLLVTGSKSYWDYNFDNATSTNTVDNLDLTSKEVYNNDLFFPHREKWNECPGYWLASSSRKKWYVCDVDCMHGRLDTNQGGFFAGIRPMVKIPKTLFK